jgi:hypothetical protein
LNPPPFESVGRMRKIVIAGWIISLVGTAIWLYGYFVTGEPPLVNWQAISPWWIADFLPNRESEVGMTLVLVSMVPMYWPPRRVKRSGGDLADGSNAR